MHNLLKINIVKMTTIDHKIAFRGTKNANSVPCAFIQAFRVRTGITPFLEKNGGEIPQNSCCHLEIPPLTPFTAEW